ncbi:Por secretion system C-terminal sorting domain-containing protein [Dyadobacter sp. SG02]|uniref:T9SS type A sorting domain-containing protein n=1 Tax=Dyadobacter sp. SG02 TaxID=1855291 RepID=UPI0008D2BF93|nr:T9SS type A sorting domain-containing protein [Dyadobacter sp. SG02]SEJ40464.1 Por secretion system C-terminal sorting domain-containing protein [Dyadobacter sp. SG02]
MKLVNLLFLGLVSLSCGAAMAQTMVPQSFRYHADTTGDRQPRFLTQVTWANTSFLRLYFKGTQLGNSSFLVLEGTDGARQEIRSEDLENWRYSSAYFNGQSVNVSLVAAPGDRNTVNISSIKISSSPARVGGDPIRPLQTFQEQHHASTARTSKSASDYPYADAVGRFTNGSESHGTGWIAPNGAIVTSAAIYSGHIVDQSYDVIEFNVPASNGATVNHPAPQDQYPVSTANSDAILFSSVVPYKYLQKQTTIMAGYAIISPLPNSTGFRPGERQREYFRIARNPNSSIIESMGDVPVELLHYGVFPGLAGSDGFKTLHVTQTSLLKQDDYLSVWADAYRDDFALHNGIGVVHASGPAYGSDGGAPVTYQASNVAIGVHSHDGVDGMAPVAMGFRDDDFRNQLAHFYSANSIYVDPDGLYNPASGAIDKPYLTIQQAAQHAPAGAQVYVARNTYTGPVTIDRAMTLRAPVGEVTIGVSNAAGRRGAETDLASRVAMAEAIASLPRPESAEKAGKLRAYPNPFKDQTEIAYQLPENISASISIYTNSGTRVAGFSTDNATPGEHKHLWNGTDYQGKTVPPGLYMVTITYGNQTFTTKVLKQ